MALRAANAADLPFLLDLYATTRADERSRAPWPEAAWTPFIASQFALQHRHFVTQHPGADFLIVLRRAKPVGRLYVDRTTPTWRLLEIAMLPEERSGGAGTALLRWLQRAARGAGAAGIDLHVQRDNVGAARLYARRGFAEAISASATHRRMAWPVPVS